MIKMFTFLIISVSSYVHSQLKLITEEITVKSGVYELPGTLTYITKNTPLLIWVHGSGPVNRDGNQPNYIKQFREQMNKNGFAFFSYDKRTATPSNLEHIKKDGILITDLSNDVKAVVEYFNGNKKFSEIILVGHSQGSLLAMLALKDVSKYISLAGAGETIDQVLIRQVTNQNPLLGKITEQHLKELKETGEIKEVNPFLVSLFAKKNQPFIKSWINVNPLKTIESITIPTLIINGDKDLQVTVEDAKKLKTALPSAKLHIIKNMNHVLKHIEKDEDNIKSYMNEKYPLSKKLINAVVKFVNQ